MALTKINFGDKVKSAAIDRFRPTKGVATVIAIISKSRGCYALHQHYAEGLGWFQCFGGRCCRDFDLPETRYVFPVVVYTIKDYETLERGLPVVVQFLSLSKGQYDELLTKDKVNGNITAHDLYVTCDENKKYATPKFEVMAHAKPFWRTNKAVEAAVLKEFAHYENAIEQSIAREFANEQEYLTALERARQKVAQQGVTAPVPPPVGASGQPMPPALTQQSAGYLPQDDGGDLSDLVNSDILAESEAPGDPGVVEADFNVVGTSVEEGTGEAPADDDGDIADILDKQ